MQNFSTATICGNCSIGFAWGICLGLDDNLTGVLYWELFDREDQSGFNRKRLDLTGEFDWD